MSFKRKQYLSLGLTVLFMLLLMFVVLFMANLIKANMLEIVKDRYYKVNQVTEIRRLFDQTDRQLLRILIVKEEINPELVENSLKDNEKGIISEIISLKSTINTPKGIKLLNEIEKTYTSYNQMEQEFIAKFKSSKFDEMQTIYDAERSNRDMLLHDLGEFIEYQESLMDESLQSATKTHAQLVIVLVSAVMLALVMIVLVTLSLIRTTSKTMAKILKGLNRIDYKNLSKLPRVEIHTKDEFGEIAKSFNAMAASLEIYNEKETKYISEITEQNWIQSNSADIIHLYSHHVNIHSLGEALIRQLSHAINANLGVFYVKETENGKTVYRKKSSYAEDGQHAGREFFYPGEGLVGQCAIEKKHIILNDVPSTYSLIHTGLGSVAPRSIMMAPVLVKDEVVAVLELASLSEFTSTQLKLMEEVLDTLGIAITNILSRMEIARLLEDSQAKTEELQMQSEELQTQSEELQSQSEELQTQAEELRMINEQLEERTNDAELKSEELRSAKEALEEKARELMQSSKYKTEFLANMSHELRTPLNSILLLSEMLIDDPNHGLNEEQVEFTKVIHSSGQDLLDLINDILDLSKVEVGKLEIHFEEVNMNDFASRLERSFVPFAKKKNLEFSVTESAGVPAAIFTDEQRLQQMIKNLLSNAFKFTDAGSVSVTFEKADSHEISSFPLANCSDTWLKVIVSDTGIGIPIGKQEEIFEAFQQVDGATMRKYGGTGLGLSITKEFAQLLGGVCRVKSEEGKGSSFTLFIPSLPNGLPKRAEETMKNEAASAKDLESIIETSIENHSISDQDESPSSTVLQGKSVLVVDDDHRNIYVIKNALEKEGMHVLTAENGMECLETITKEEIIDIVLMDIMMPVMDGYETMKRIRELEEYQNLPIIALTAKAMNYDRRKCIESGASDYISKPLKLDQLLSAMRVWLS
ncbi:response regulator [Bacillus sp. DTU_2020_1000418_1_SI_GHA_SEK_038]|uniref:response regulator n=1 Tax=Bacillus sp. DTU_2020_1000418_1_SI_GHA_SEK_038 TaxID=3077585 RepID=UPI0028EB585D|nr:response regulator [Bacillus sp. DTU_2020_1000418_1_SI_GHA_SEK_038]WNS76118.1 response regulator [Bacillus sp. DTU_2020_1000418_1_SI_GHA_SEK_038]